MKPNISQSIASITQSFAGISMDSVIKAIILIIAGFIIAKITSVAIAKAMSKLGIIYESTLVRRFNFYIILILFVLAALQHLGFKLNVLLGAAGVLTVALGFASQTSVSNIISGLFLLTERPFVVGDYIKTDSITGEVLSIDLLAIKIRTSDNTLARVPNEVIIKSNIVNLTRFPIRRFDLQLRVPYKEDLEKIRKVLFEVASNNHLCLEEPQPSLHIIGFGDSGINLQFSVWSSKLNFTNLKNSLQEQIKKAFEINHIEISSSH
jgi:small-conductance mechanosensitive channel